MSNGQDEIYQMVTDRIIEALEKGAAPWQKPWIDYGRPINGISKKAYRGINSFLLALMPYQSNIWLSFQQVKKKGGNVKKGEKSTPVIFWKFFKVEEEKDGKTTTKRVPLLRYYNVFNIEQTTLDVPEKESKEYNFTPIEHAEKIIADMPQKPVIEHNPQACYKPLSDKVGIPKKTSFKKPSGYYCTLFHELVHSTGHKSRLERDGITKLNHFGSHEYSKEELIAEMGAAYLLAECGIKTEINNNAAYIDNWLSVLKDKKNRKWLVSAAGKAQKAADFILNRKHEEE